MNGAEQRTQEWAVNRFWKRIHDGERIVFSTNGNEKTGYPQVKKKNETGLLHRTQKIYSKCNPFMMENEDLKLF